MGHDSGKKQPSILEESHSHSNSCVVLRSRKVPGWCLPKGPQLSCGGDIERLGVLLEG